MHLTRILNIVWKTQKRVPGRLHGGEHQRFVPIKASWKEKAVKWMVMEQQNMDLLDNPYIKKSEEAVYGNDHGLRKIKREASFARLIAKRRKERPFKPDMTLVDHFEHLNVNKKWE